MTRYFGTQYAVPTLIFSSLELAGKTCKPFFPIFLRGGEHQPKKTIQKIKSL
jgi:hypothetical protein